MKLKCILLNISLCFLLASPILAERNVNWGFGPPELENQYAFGLMHRSFSPRSPEVREEGSSTFTTRFAWSNNYILDDSFVVDDETRYLDLKASYVPIKDLEISFSLPVLWRGGGVLDSFIEDWHDFFGLPGGNRDTAVDDSFSYSAFEDNGETFLITRDGYSLGTASLGAKYLLTPGTKNAPAWALTFDLGLPTARDSFGQENLDFIAGLIGSYNYSRFSFYWGGAYSLFLDDEIAGVNFEKHHAEGFLSIEYRILDSLAFVLSTYAHSNLIDNLDEHSSFGIYNDFAFIYRATEAMLLELLLRENPGGGDGTSDVTFGLGAKIFF